MVVWEIVNNKVKSIYDNENVKYEFCCIDYSLLIYQVNKFKIQEKYGIQSYKEKYEYVV